MEFVSIPGPTRSLAPQAIVLLNAETGVPDDVCSHVYGYDETGKLITDTATDGINTWIKTYSYTAGNLTGETKWVKQ
ncbi:MAG: hypothetical protein FD135_2359 [Comamonadaceae bacterium]|nr:MAG: hypothetical protein FD135_2359 [Comamonadaceae bacterium]